MTSLLMQAAQSAAAADGLTAPSPDFAFRNAGPHSMAPPPMKRPAHPVAPPTTTTTTTSSKGPPLRRGKWTPEEEAYANRLIQEFKAGLLPLTDGTTLRTFLSKLLNCDPMRISKKFVGSNCIGKQVFRRRTADLNRLTPEQIQQSRAELSELERRFLERVAQTNRVKTSGVGSTPGGGGGGMSDALAGVAMDFSKPDVGTIGLGATGIGNVNGMNSNTEHPPSPPWLQPPLGFKHGMGAAFAAQNMSGGANSRAAAAGRALLGNSESSAAMRAALERKASGNGLPSFSAGNNGDGSVLAALELQRRASQQSLLQSLGQGESTANFLAAARSSGNFSNAALAQLAQNASAARLSGMSNNDQSLNELMLKTGLSRSQLSQLAQERGVSSHSLTNMMQRQNSFDALMSLDFQSLQSIDNLANLIQSNGGVGQHKMPEAGMRNADFSAMTNLSRQNLAALAAQSSGQSRGLGNSASGRMESFLRNFSSGNNLRGNDSMAMGSNANFHNLLQSMQQGSSSSFGDQHGLMGGGSNHMGQSTASLLAQGNSASAVSLANLLRQDSSTGLTALRMQDGLTHRNTSVDDFLSLMAAGDIPHQDASLLNVPLLQQQGGSASQQEAAAKLLAAQRQMMQGSHSNLDLSSTMANAMATRFGNGTSSGGNSTSAAALAMAQARAASKRKLEMLGGEIDGNDKKR